MPSQLTTLSDGTLSPQILRKRLHDKEDVTKARKEKKPRDRRVSFANDQDLETLHLYAKVIVL